MRHVSPLPIRVRLVHGESLPSYANALAVANHQTVAEVEAVLRSRGLLTTHARSSGQRKSLWRALGALHPRAFTQPVELFGQPIPERLLCPQCARRHAHGYRPDVGLICLRHKAWFGYEMRCTDDAALNAERIFRHNVAPWAHSGSPIWHLAQECALTTTATDLLDTRSGGTDIRRAYPETVAYASLILTPTFLATLLDPRAARADRLTAIRAAVAPLATGEDPWRAETRLMDLSRDLMTSGGIQKWCLSEACEAATTRASSRSSASKEPRRRATGPTAAAS